MMVEINEIIRVLQLTSFSQDDDFEGAGDDVARLILEWFIFIDDDDDNDDDDDESDDDDDDDDETNIVSNA